MSPFSIFDTHRTRLVFALLASVTTLVLYWGMTDHLFDADDMEYLKDTQRVWQDPARFFSDHRAFPGRPTVEILFLAVFPFFGENPAAYHLLLIGLHIFAGLFFGHTLRAFGARFDLCMLASFLFLVNVAHFRAVHWIACLGYPVALSFGLGALLCYERYLSGHRRSLFGSLLWMVLAVCSHAGVSALALFAVYRTWQREQSVGQAIRKALPLLAVAVVSSAVLYLLFPKASQVLAVVHEPSALRTAKLFLWFVSRLFTAAHWWPTGLTDQPQVWEMVIGGLAVLVLASLILKSRFPADQAAVWTLLTILPFINNPHLIMFGPSRYLYFASAGAAILFAQFFLFLTSRLPERTGRIALPLLVVVLFFSSHEALKRGEALSLYHAGRSYIGKMFEQTGAELMERALASDPHIARIVPEDVYVRLSITLFGLGKSPRPYLKRAIAINPDDPQLNILLGISKSMDADPDVRQSGLSGLQETLQETSDTQHKLIASRSYTNIGRYAMRHGDYEKAAQAFKQAQTFWPNDALTGLFFAHALYLKEAGVSAVETDVERLQMQIDEHPEDASARLKLARALRASGHIDQAVEVLKAGLQSTQDMASLYEFLGVLLLEQEEFTSALDMLDKAIARAPDSTVALHSKAQIVQMLGQYRVAFQALQQVLRLSPENAAVYHSFGALFQAIGETGQARAYFDEALKRNPDLFD